MMKTNKSLKAQGNKLSESRVQLEILDNVGENNSQFERFDKKLENLGLYPLKPVALEILQINLGYMCNQTCEHCHVDAGPDRKEIMDRETMSYCLEVLKATPSIHTIDLTGGAPEMNPDFLWFVEEISALKRKTIVRSNLTILVSNKKFRTYPDFFAKHKITVIASLPCYTEENTDKQRGSGVFSKSIEALKILNELGYGKPESGLELDLVYNPIGANLPPDQQKLEKDYKRILNEKFQLKFNHLYTITNLPISRFLDFLLAAGKYENYMETLVNAFNPSTVNNVMCRNTLSVGWKGNLYDCDFNQMLELPVAPEANRNIKDFDLKKLSNRNIVVNQHCYGCTAGAGSSCQGSLL